MRYLLVVLLFLFAAPAMAQQETPEEERSLFLRFVEDKLSAPNRQIRISGINGVLSSNATIGQITVADNEGVWLRINNASIVWSRSALIFRQRLQIDTLAAESIEYIRQPIADESMPAPESSAFQLPELPIAINLDNLDVPRISFSEEVFGLESELGIAGRISLEDGSLDTALEVTRLDGPGGQLSLTATYANATEQLALDFDLSEPADGVVANLIGIEGRPPVDLAVTGNGPLSDLEVSLTLDAAGERVLTGETRLQRQAEGLAYTAELSGPIAQLIPAQFRSFFGAETSLTSSGLVKNAGGLVLQDLQLRSAALSLQAAAETSSDWFLRRLALDATIDEEGDAQVVLPVPGGETTVESAAVTISYGETADDDWSGSITVAELTTTQFSAERASFDLGGVASSLDQPDARAISFAVDGALSGIVATRADIAEALGDEITLDIEGSWNAGEPVRLANAALAGNGLSVTASGDIAELAFDGELGVEAASIAPFSGLAGRDLSGSLDLEANGEVRPISGAFDLTIDSSAQELRIGIEAADNLLAGTTTITGRVARGEQGLLADELRVANEQVELLADGTFATGTADFDYSLVLADLALVSPQAEGRLEAEGRAVGADGLITLTTTATVPSGSLAGKNLTEARISFEGTLEESNLDGSLAGDAFLDGTRVQLSTGIIVAEGERRLSDFEFSAGGANASGAITQSAEGLLNGQFTIDAADISTAAALFLVEATGAVDAEVALVGVEGRQNATLGASVRNFALGETTLDDAEIQAAVEDLFNVPIVEGSIEASGLTAGGVEVASLAANARSRGETTDFQAGATLENGAVATASGSLAPEGEGYRVSLEEASLSQGGVGARLVDPASVLVEGQTFTVDGIVIDVGGGRVSVDGRVADELDLDVTVAQLPLSIANIVRPDLALGGTIDAEATIAGSRADPRIDFTLAGDGITAAALRQAGQSSLDIEARGATRASRLDLEASVTSPEGLRATVDGGVPLDDGQLALDVALEAFPLAALNAVVSGQELGGTITGSARVTGTTAEPQASFDLRGTSLTAAPLRTAGLGPLTASANGSFADQAVRLNAVNVSGPSGLSVEASGTVPLSGGGLSVNVSGTAPLSIADRFLADRGTQISGTLQASANVTGSIQQPVIRGDFSTGGAQVVDPETNLRLRDIGVSASINGDTISLNSATAALSTGGSISAGGTVSIADGFPADLRISLNQARYADGNFVVATLSGALTVTGALARDPLIAGEINVERAELSVPQGLGGGATAIDVVHINPPPDVRATLTRARANDGTPTPTSRPSVVRLDIGVSAPNQIFVRGRGLDAELGGSVRLTGPLTDIQPVGAFNLVRGRLSILGERITFDEGTLTLVGDLDPFVNFIARSEGDEITVFITLSGRISDLNVDFSSQPQLPEDEVLARLIFDRGIDELSPLQIAQLAAAVAELAGGSNNSLLGSLRQATGLDDLDIVTDSQGNAALRAGRYIQDNVYVGVEAGAGGTTRGTINLDITEDLKAKGAVGSDGDSSLGLFYERDY